MMSPIHIGETKIEFVDTAEHVGVLRSTSGNLPHIQQRIANHKKSLAQILSMGLSRGHRANPVAALRAEIFFPHLFYSQALPPFTSQNLKLLFLPSI